MRYNQAVTEDRRLAVLRILEQSPGYSANPYLLQRLLDGMGHAASYDTIKTDLHWLEEHGLLQIETLGGMPIPTLTMRGVDVAQGRAIVPGVARPMPE